MKLKILIPVGICLTLLFSSCLKDTPFMDVSNTQPVIEFGLSAASGNAYGAFQFIGDTINSTVSTYDTAIALVVASPQVLSSSVTATVAIDTTQISPFNAGASSVYVPGLQNELSNDGNGGGPPVYVQFLSYNQSDSTTALSTNFTTLPSNLYNMTTTITIAPGYRVGRIPVNLSLSSLPTHHSYVLPLKIVDAKTANGDTLIVSPNSNTFMWYFQR